MHTFGATGDLLARCSHAASQAYACAHSWAMPTRGLHPSPPPPFNRSAQWKREIDSKVTLPNGKPLPVVLLANKVRPPHTHPAPHHDDTAPPHRPQDDLPEHAVSKDELDAFARDNGFVAWFATSAKTNTGIEEATKGLVTSILDHPGAARGRCSAWPAQLPSAAPPPHPRADAFEAQRVLAASKTGAAAGVALEGAAGGKGGPGAGGDAAAGGGAGAGSSGGGGCCG
jgi:hypothetical protein